MEKQFNLGVRTMIFAANIREFIKPAVNNLLFKNDVQQLLRSSGSVAANYIEANESLSRKDFIHRLRICRKEAKESKLWLQLLNAPEFSDNQRKILEDEARQLLLIFSSIIRKMETK